MKSLSAVMVLLVALPLVCCSSVYAKGGKKETLKPGEKVDINTASKEDLMKLPGVGEKKAEKIISNRPYSSIEDLKTKKIGVGDKTLERWREHITCSGAAAAAPAAEAVKAAPETKAEPKAAAPETKVESKEAAPEAKAEPKEAAPEMPKD